MFEGLILRGGGDCSGVARVWNLGGGGKRRARVSNGGQASDEKIERSERSILAGGDQGAEPPEAPGFLQSRDP